MVQILQCTVWNICSESFGLIYFGVYGVTFLERKDLETVACSAVSGSCKKKQKGLSAHIHTCSLFHHANFFISWLAKTSGTSCLLRRIIYQGYYFQHSLQFKFTHLTRKTFSKDSFHKFNYSSIAKELCSFNRTVYVL